MKNKLQQLLIMSSKFTLYGMVVQLFFVVSLWATELAAQETKSVKEVNLSMQVESKTILDIFRIIEQKTAFKFFYENKYIDRNLRYDFNSRSISVNDILLQISRESNLKFKQINNTINVTTKEPGQNGRTSEIEIIIQTRTITGKVTSMEDSEGLPGVNVVEKGTSNGTVTDIQGNYSLEVSEGATLVFSSVGYTQEEVEVGNRSVIDLTMTQDIQQLQELVVVGYGEQKKVNLTGSVGFVKGKEIAEQPLMQTSEALMGKIPGVTVLQNSGQPGSTATIRIRGVGTLGDANPLVLIDGVPGDMNGLDPNDIEDISVLKDAAAGAIYGSRAANGVILITTKRGEAGQINVNYNGYVGWQQPTNLPKFLDATGYMREINVASVNQGADPLFTEEEINSWNQNNLNDPDRYPNTDWVDETFSENGFQQHHNVSISGGNEMAKIMGSLSVMDQTGNIPNFNFKRYQARLNTDLKISEKFKLLMDFNFRQTQDKEPSAGLFNVVNQAFRTPPIFPSIYSDGSWGEGYNFVSNSVAASRASGTNENTENYFRGVINAQFNLIEGLDLSVMYAPEIIDNVNKRFQKSYSVFDIDNGELLQRVPAINNLSQSNRRSFSHNFNSVLKFSKIINQNEFGILGGYEVNTQRVDFFNASRDNFLLQDFDQLTSGSRENMQNDGSAFEWALQSFFTRVNYSFDSKYLFEANLRYDGSSRFAEGNKYGVFPSFSLGWRLSEESFMNNLGIFDNFKVRASWGQLGNQNIGFYPFASTIVLGRDYIVNGVPVSGAAQTELANQNITWETTETTNLGLDFSVLNNRLSLTFDYFNRRTSDILLRIPVPSIIGLSAPFQNAGVVDNKGWELMLDWRDDINDFSYGINFNISDVVNEVVDLRDTGPFIGTNTIITEGEPINSIYGFKTIGFFQSQDEVDNSPTQIGAVAPGDLKYENQLTVDTNNDGIPDEADDVINSLDRQVLGNPFPRFNFGSNINASYKNFDISIFLQGTLQKDIYLDKEVAWAFYEGGKIQEWHLDYWTENNRDAAYPRLTTGSVGNNFQVTDFWMWNASFLRLRNLTVGYTIPGRLSSNLIQSARIYFTAQNLFTIDSMPAGYDPDIPNGTRGVFYPIIRNFNVGVNVTF